MSWRAALNALYERGEAGVLVTVAAARGHSPREAGAKMVVTADQTFDSVGGGNLEATATERARALLSGAATKPELLTLRLTDHAANDHG
ncbi:XdhC family protein, partial [Deinococcus sp.]|uniref:XdhC family protein n=1 Tax=Deinococcus sp. TaxID=47478 RepID=UPI0028699119